MAKAVLILLVLEKSEESSLNSFSGEVRANPVRIAIRVQDELYQPLVPVTKNFKSCFKLGPDGTPMVSLCAEETPPPPRAPAAKPAQQRRQKRPR